MALLHTGFFSQALGMCVSCDVILPQFSSSLIGMKTAAARGPRKVLYLLHGMSDDETIWQRRTSIERYAAPLGLAVVMPAAQISSYANMAHGGRYFDYIADELPETMRGFFGFSDRREDNFIAGLSMGGAGCMKIGLARPERFGAIGCLSAGASNRRPGQDADPRRAKYNLMAYGDGANLGPEEDVLGNAKKLAEAAAPAPESITPAARRISCWKTPGPPGISSPAFRAIPLITPTKRTPALTPGNSGTSTFSISWRF